MNSLNCVLSMLILTVTGAVPSFAESSRDLHRAVELLGDIPSATDPETLKELGLKGQGALMGMEESGRPSPVAAREPAARNQGDLQNYIKSEYGGNRDPKWEREASRSVPAPKAGKGQSGSKKGSRHTLLNTLNEIALLAAAPVIALILGARLAYAPATVAAWVTSKITGKLKSDPNINIMLLSTPLAAITGVGIGLEAGPAAGALSAVGMAAVLGALAEVVGP